MIIRNLRLRNFRNYASLDLDLDPGLNWITGQNAQGKTNLLESMVCLSLTRSFRVNDDRKMIRSGCEFADLSCAVESSKEIHLREVIHSGGKTLFINRQAVTKTSEFIGILNTVLFSPDDLGIFLDAPMARRKLLDQEITKVSSGYLYALKHYRSLLKDRNALLKQVSPDRSYLDVLDSQMIHESEVIIQERREFLKRINERIQKIYQKLSLSSSELIIQYQCCIKDEDCASALGRMFETNRERDLEFRMTGAGIHREDILFTLDGENVIYGASQGQKRMILLAMKLAFIPYIEETAGQRPVLLLDDVLSELDEQRQKTLLELIGRGGQCVITGTGIPDSVKREGFREIRIDQGRLIGGRQ